MLKENADNKTGKYKNVAMMFLAEGWVFCIIIEEVTDEGFIMLYVPSAPIPTSGTLYLIPEDKVKRVNIPVHTALSNIWHLGKNADKIFKVKIEN